MVTDDLSVLSAELRKAAFCKWCFDKKTRNSYCQSNEKDNKHFFVLPAVLVEQEMLRREVVEKGKLEKYFEREDIKMMLLIANSNCDNLLRVLPINEKLWKLVRVIKKAIQDIETEAYEKKVEEVFGK